MSTAKVVILNWNGSAHLKTFLPSVLSTTLPDVGIVVADNGSTDDSLEVLSELFPSVEVVSLDRNYGFAGGYNRALSEIDADYVILINSDVATSAGWCEPLIRLLESDPCIGAVQPKIRSYTNKNNFEYAGASGGFIDIFGYPFCRGRILSTIEQDRGQYDSPREIFWASGACFACRREIFQLAGGFDDEFFAHMEEIDLCWRMQLYGFKIRVEPSAVVYHLGGGTLPNNSPRKIYLNYRNSLGMLYKNLSRSQFMVILPFRVVMDGFSALIFLIQGRSDFFRSVLSAHKDFYRWRKKLRSKRAEVQSRTKVNPTGVYRGSIVFRYFFFRKKFGKLL